MKPTIVAWPFSIFLLSLLSCGGERAIPLSSSPSTVSSVPAAAGSPAVTNGSTTSTGDLVHLDGPLSSLAGSCPTVMFTVLNTTVSTTAATRFVGGTCAQLSNGTRVVLEGTRQNGAVLANGVKSVPPIVHLEGTLSALQGACPAVTFMVGQTAVSTAETTRFAGKSCSQLANGDAVSVDGELDNGSVDAVDVQNRMSPVQITGAVSALQGSCPTVTFAVDRFSVSTTASTRFAGGACADVTNGRAVAVDGTFVNNVIDAADVQLRR